MHLHHPAYKFSTGNSLLELLLLTSTKAQNSPSTHLQRDIPFCTPRLSPQITLFTLFLPEQVSPQGHGILSRSQRGCAASVTRPVCMMPRAPTNLFFIFVYVSVLAASTFVWIHTVSSAVFCFDIESALQHFFLNFFQDVRIACSERWAPT